MGVFTTHTPVPAGHDRFDAGLIEEHVGPLGDELGLQHHSLVGLGRVDPQNPHESFCMTVLAFRLSRHANAVSSLHGIVSRRMWASLWPWRSEEEIPIGHITNGVHVPTWLASQMRVLYDRVLPINWYLRTGEPQVWAGLRAGHARRALGDASVAQEPADRLRADAAGGPGRTPGPRRSHSAEIESESPTRGADDRLRAAIRSVQAGRPRDA